MNKLLVIFILMCCLSCSLAQYYYGYNNNNRYPDSSLSDEDDSDESNEQGDYNGNNNRYPGSTGKFSSLLNEDDSDESDEKGNYNSNNNRYPGSTGKISSLLNEDDSDESDEKGNDNNNNNYGKYKNNNNFGSYKSNNYGNSDLVENYFKPPMELLQLAETFLRLKGQVIEKIVQVLYVNRDLVRDVTKFFITHASSIHRSTLGFIQILRKILEFGAGVFSNWNPSQSQSSYNNYRPNYNYYKGISVSNPVASSVNNVNQEGIKSISEAIADILRQ